MAAPTTTSARAPDQEQPAAPLTEPSMEDILASIRRIIAEDQSHGLARSGLTGLTRRNQAAEIAPTVPAPSPAEPADSPAHDKLAPEETELHAAPQADLLGDSYEADDHFNHPATIDQATTFPASETDAFEPEDRGDDHAFEPMLPSLDAPVGAAVATSGDDGEPLMSSSTGASITSSFQALAESVVLQDPGLVERVMRETMRPLLKEWLDDHLPSIVERLVRAEIERVARGGRSH